MSLRLSRRGTLAPRRAAAGGLSYADEVLADNPTIYWRMEDSIGATSITDSSGNGFAGTRYGVVLEEAGAVGNAGYFDGVDDRVIRDSEDEFAAPDGMCFELWFKNPSDTTADGAGWWRGDGSGKWNHFSPRHDNIRFTLTTSSTIDLDHAVTLDDDTFHHAAGTWDGTTMSIVLDGVVVATTAKTGTATDPNQKMGIGARSQSNDNWFLGHIDEAAFYNHHVPTARLQAHYNAGVA